MTRPENHPIFSLAEAYQIMRDWEHSNEGWFTADVLSFVEVLVLRLSTVLERATK
jgi:hypothetical protein